MNLKTLKGKLLTSAAPVITFVMTTGVALAQDADASDKTIADVIKASGIIGVVIILLSVVALAIIIENFVSLKRDKLAPPEIIDEIQALFDEGQYQEAMELCENEPNYFTRVCGAGISKIGHTFDAMEKAIEEMGDQESIKLHQKIGWLALIANVAPMMGLLGTVSGMVTAFNTIASSGGHPGRARRRYLPGAPHHDVRPDRRDPRDRVLRLHPQPDGEDGHRGRRDRRGPLRALPRGELIYQRASPAQAGRLHRHGAAYLRPRPEHKQATTVTT